jgi:hypothetical protein
MEGTVLSKQGGAYPEMRIGGVGEKGGFLGFGIQYI